MLQHLILFGLELFGFFGLCSQSFGVGLGAGSFGFDLGFEFGEVLRQIVAALVAVLVITRAILDPRQNTAVFVISVRPNIVCAGRRRSDDIVQ